MTDVQCPIQLRDLYLAGRLIPFVGAGISAGVTWTDNAGDHAGPSWGKLVDKAAEIVGFGEPDLLRARGTDLQILEYFRIKRHGETAELTQWLTTALNPPDDVLAASAVHRALAAMNLSTLFYTTNYDSFIEDAFRLHGRANHRVVTEGDIADAVSAIAAGGPHCEVVKFHGDLLHPKAMVLSERDYESRLRLTEALDHKLRHDLLGRAVLFLGYSFRDWNVAYLFRLLNDEQGNLPASSNGRRAFIVVADPSDFEITLFNERNIEVIPIDGTRRSEEISSLLAQLIEAPRV
jgi:hypothetical protein